MSKTLLTEPTLELYCHYLEHERRLSTLTVKHYRRDVEELLTLLSPEKPTEATGQRIRQLIGKLHAQGLGERSLSRLLSAWRGFYHYLIRQRLMTQNPCHDVRSPKVKKHLPHALSPDRAQLLMSDLGEEPTALRDHALLELFYSSGLRLQELASLNRSDIQWDEHTLRVTGKGSKTRIVPIGRFASDAIKRYLMHAEKQYPQENALFLSRDGQRLSQRSIQQRVKLRAQQLGLADHVHPHVLRHSFASHVLQSSGDLRAVQEMLGHASIVSTQVYTHLDFQHLAQVYDASHPRAKTKAKKDNSSSSE
ncbi:MAG: tyrosine recombinase XerC [Betaproteobacteria bacterium]|nr:tyrosine recombinase XerC [Betaproteobacteria bacterium]MDE2422664.1 tyrosine recombinase XerC [Betaproteobacteria bacterium]